MIKNISFLFIILIFTGCAKENQSLELHSESIIEKELEVCKNHDCPSVTVNYLTATGPEEIADQINKKIQDFVIGTLHLREDAPRPESVEQATTEFIQNYFDDLDQFPDSLMEYEAEVSVTELLNSRTLLSLHTFSYLFTGGAHGYAYNSYLNINPETGKEYTLDEIFKNIDEFTALMEVKFRKEKEIPEDVPINDHGFWFGGDGFYLPDHIGFTDKEVILYYNQYEIASYADGPTDLSISIEEAKPFLTDRILAAYDTNL